MLTAQHVQGWVRHAAAEIGRCDVSRLHEMQGRDLLAPWPEAYTERAKTHADLGRGSAPYGWGQHERP